MPKLMLRLLSKDYAGMVELMDKFDEARRVKRLERSKIGTI
jgi:hypothetical protein